MSLNRALTSMRRDKKFDQLDEIARLGYALMKIA